MHSGRLIALVAATAVAVLGMMPHARAQPYRQTTTPTIPSVALGLPDWAWPAGSRLADEQTFAEDDCFAVPTLIPEWCTMGGGLPPLTAPSTGEYQTRDFGPGDNWDVSMEWQGSSFATDDGATAVVNAAKSVMAGGNIGVLPCRAIETPSCALFSYDQAQRSPGAIGTGGVVTTVLYQVWADKNVSGQLAVEETDTGPYTNPHPLYDVLEPLAANADKVLQAALAGATPQPPASTTIPTARPSATPTATPTPTVVPAPQPTAAPVLFSVAAVKVETANAKPDWSLKRGSLSGLKVGQQVKLSLYASFGTVQQTTGLDVGMRVTHARKTVMYHRGSDTVTSKDTNGLVWYWVHFTPKLPGQYTFTGTVFLNGKHKHKALTFNVAQR